MENKYYTKAGFHVLHGNKLILKFHFPANNLKYPHIYNKKIY